MIADVTRALASAVPSTLCKELIDEFVELKRDAATATLGRSAPGKFVETVVQCLQHLERGSYDPKPNVDDYLKNLESRSSGLDDGLRICAARIARSMYSLRNKRNIAHKGQIDPNENDLRFLFHSAQWILAELVRTCSSIPMADAGALVAQIQVPVDAVVENVGSERIVLADLSTKSEILVLLHSSYPNATESTAILQSLKRRKPDTVRKALRELWDAKLLAGPSGGPYSLTQKGFQEASAMLAKIVSG